MQPVKLPGFVDKLFILRSLIKPILQLWTLFHMLLFKIQRPDFLIVQVRALKQIITIIILDKYYSMILPIVNQCTNYVDLSTIASWAN